MAASGYNFVKELEDDASQLNRLLHYTNFKICNFKFKILRTALSKFYGQAEWAISIRQLRALLHFHFGPIKQVVFLCPSYPLRVGRSNLEECFTLICIQRLSQPNFATQPCH